LVTSEVTGTPKPEDEEMDLVDVQDLAAAAKAMPDHEYSREDEIEKLRTSGSMTQNQTEISRVRNLEKIQMGKFEVEPWYFSPYPIDFVDSDVVYICEFCLSYFGEVTQFERHRSKCTLLHPPGNEIYRDDYVSFFEIDGRRQRTWCRNLCLLSKLFLDHKTLYYDVDPFLFYCMCTRDEHGCHFVGYFSKEKESAVTTLPVFSHFRSINAKGLANFSLTFHTSCLNAKASSDRQKSHCRIWVSSVIVRTGKRSWSISSWNQAKSRPTSRILVQRRP
jgi:histone acetyltransferase HTATIP